ncbi:MAG: hypothetical protein K0U47_10665 [Epsilonproteobacteria bacterium]|nr:hypothetical protein [Campylobacterota bacterium]
MELKDLILSTLNELDAKIEEDGYTKEKEVAQTSPKPQTMVDESDELSFLMHSKERLEVLFEGLNSPELTKVEAKQKLVINFLQFYLSEIDERIAKLSQ